MRRPHRRSTCRATSRRPRPRGGRLDGARSARPVSAGARRRAAARDGAAPERRHARRARDGRASREEEAEPRGDHGHRRQRARRPGGRVPFRADPKKEPPAPSAGRGRAHVHGAARRAPWAPSRQSPKKKPNLGATMGVDFGEVRERATPFERAAPSAPAPVAPAPASRTRADDDDDDDAPRTGLLDPEAVAIALKKAMPFGGPLGPPAASPPASAPAAALRDERGAPKTAFFDASQLGLQPSGGLPFGAGPTTSRLPGGAGSPPPIPPPQPLHQPPKPSPSQPSMPAVTGNAQRRPESTSSRRSRPIAEQPTDVEAIRKRYGVTEAEHDEWA